MLRLIYQSAEIDCGPAILATLYNHFYKKEITSIDILKKSSSFYNQMTLFDLEANAKTFNLDLESFYGDIEAVNQVLKKDPVILLLDAKSSGHYVIATKKGNKIKIFDPKNGEYYIDNLEKIYNGIYVLCKKANNQSKYFINVNKELKISFKYFFVTLLLHSLTVTTAIFAGKYFEIVISSAINNQSVSNLINLSSLFAIVYLLNAFSSLLLGLYKQKKLIYLYYELFGKVIETAKYKLPNFYNKTNKNEIQNIDSYCLSWISYKIFSFTEVIMNFVIFCVVLVVVATIHWEFLIILFVIVIFTSFVCFLDYNWKKKQVLINKMANDNFKESIFNAFYESKHEKDFERMLIFEREAKANFSNQVLQVKVNTIFYENIASLKNIFENLIFVITVFLGSFLLINNSSINLGQITFFLAMISLQKGTVQLLFLWTSNRTLMNQYEAIIQKFLHVDNSKNYLGLSLKEVKVIQLKNLVFNYDNKQIFLGLNQEILNKSLIRGPSGIGKSTLSKIIAGQYQVNSGEIFFNSISSDLISTKWMQKNILILNNQHIFPNKKICDLVPLNNPVVIEALMSMNISINDLPNDNLSHGQKQLVRLLELVNVRNNVLIFDEFLVNIDHSTKHWIMTNVIVPLMEKNFVLWITHETSLDAYFKNIIEWGVNYQ